MAYWRIKNVTLKGVTGTVPDHLVTSHEFPFFTEEEADTFNATVGIKQRFLADETVCASDLCFDAAERLLAALDWDRQSIDVLIFESVTGDYKTPPTSSILQERLKLPTTTFVLDVPMGCCGCLYAINVAGNLLSAGTAKRALVLIGDTASRMGSPKDKSRVPLFGDGGVALAMEYDENAEDIIMDFNTMGSGYEALITPHGGYRHPTTIHSFEEEDFGKGIIRAPKDALIHGMDVFSFAITNPPASLKKLMEKELIGKDKDVDYFLIHQANKLIVDRFVKKMKINPTKVPYNLQKFGNLGGASIPMLMVSEIADQLSSQSLTLVCSAFGLGLTWGSMVMKTEPMVVLPVSFL